MSLHIFYTYRARDMKIRDNIHIAALNRTIDIERFYFDNRRERRIFLRLLKNFESSF
jgi:hypothetical protein